MSTSHGSPQLAVSRRHFLLVASLTAAALGHQPPAGVSTPTPPTPNPLCLWYDRPATTWMTEALPIGNGPMGAMLFGATDIERIQFNEISLWSGDRIAVEGRVLGDTPKEEQQNLGAYQAFGDIFIHLGHDLAKVTDFRRELDIDRAVHQVSYQYNGVRYQRTAFASHPSGVIVIHLTADKPAACTGRIQLADMHQARISAVGNRLTSVGRLDNAFEYEAQLLVLNTGGTVAPGNDEPPAKNPWNIAVPAASLDFDRCDSVPLILAAGTNFVQDHTRQWLGEHPHAAVTSRVDSAAKLSVDELLARHVKDYQSLFRRLSLDVGTTPPELLARTTLARLESYAKHTTPDPSLEALFCQFGRYLLISCSRPGSLPANLQGVWNDSNSPAWAGDYHSNINIEMNYWPAEVSNLAECHRPFIDYVNSIRVVSAANTRNKYGNVRGWTVQTMNNACGLSFWKWNPPGSAWYAQHLWEHFAFPSRKPILADINEKALFERAPYSSAPGVKPFLPTSARYTEPGAASVIAPSEIVDLTKQLKPDRTLDWAVPPGDWTIVRMGRRVTGADTRPAPAAAAGLECDKFDAKALDDHLGQFVGVLLGKIGPRAKEHGLTTLHMDSWESGAQNWTASFLDVFKKRRGYDARPWLLTYTGRAVESVEQSERFLWDLRLTGQELVLENHAGAVKQYAHSQGLTLSIEPYDMNPAGDLDLGAVADVPMAEFWDLGGFDTSFSCFEASSIAHTMGRPIVSAESFTGGRLDAYPWSLKNQGDWAFCAGINRFAFHTWAHQALGDAYKPGMTMGPYGVHWHRNQTWWPMVSAYHNYITRCSDLLRQGVTVSDVLYLTPEGAPQVFRPPPSALEGSGPLADKKGYGFDGCSPRILMARAQVEDGLIAFPGGSSYRLMVLPQIQTMTPALLAKVRDLVRAGATVVGSPPLKSPSLSGYPACDGEVESLAKDLWGSLEAPRAAVARGYGKGFVHWGGELSPPEAPALYPTYDMTASLLARMNIKEDFTSTGPVRYGHRRTDDREIYFVSNRTGAAIKADCRFRVGQGSPELWDPVTGERRALVQFERADGLTVIPLEFDAYQSFFVVFGGSERPGSKATRNFPESKPVQELSGGWDLAFDPKWGGPEKITFDTLQDWTTRSEPGIKYYSGIATYRKQFDLTQLPAGKTHLDLGVVHDMARVRLNGHDLGVVWCAPWSVEITGALKAGNNQLEIEVVNRWANRMIGDKQPGDTNTRTVECPPGFLGGQQIRAGRYTFSTSDPYEQGSPLLPSGLVGPIRVMRQVAEGDR